MSWIAISPGCELPKPDEVVMAVIDGHRCFQAYRNSIKEWWFCGSIRYPTAWLRIPEYVPPDPFESAWNEWNKAGFSGVYRDIACEFWNAALKYAKGNK